MAYNEVDVDLPPEGSILLKDPEQLRRLLDEMLERAVIPHAKRIMRIWFDGNMPVVFDPNIDEVNR